MILLFLKVNLLFFSVFLKVGSMKHLSVFKLRSQNKNSK